MAQDVLKSLTIRFDPEEDRLVLRLLMGNRSESQTLVHLTRRVVQSLRSQLQALADLSAQVPEHLPQTARSQVQAMHHEAVAAQMPATQGPPIERTAETRLWLALDARCGRQPRDGKWVIRLELRDAQPLTIALSDTTLHATIALLNRQVALAGWQLPSMALEQSATAEPSAGPSHEFH
jgi:hypothetical protein